MCHNENTRYLGVNPACQLGRGNILTVFWGKVSSKNE